MKRHIATTGLPLHEIPFREPTSVLTPRILRELSGGNLSSVVSFGKVESKNQVFTQIVEIRNEKATVQVEVLVRNGETPWSGTVSLVEALMLTSEFFDQP